MRKNFYKTAKKLQRSFKNLRNLFIIIHYNNNVGKIYLEKLDCKPIVESNEESGTNCYEGYGYQEYFVVFGHHHSPIAVKHILSRVKFPGLNAYEWMLSKCRNYDRTFDLPRRESNQCDESGRWFRVILMLLYLLYYWKCAEMGVFGMRFLSQRSV